MEKNNQKLKDFEYLLHHIAVSDSGKEEIHHCFVYDHIGNLFVIDHLVIKNGKAELAGKKIKDGIYHVIGGLELKQDINWSNEEAEENRIIPKNMISGMTNKEKAKEW